MLLSLLWNEIVGDDMKMFSVKVMKLLIWKVLLKLNSKSYHVVKEKRIIYDAILKARHERNSKVFFFFSPCLVLMRRELARRGSQWGGGIYGYRLKFWLFYGYRLIFLSYG